jgi:hypothetical protein
MKKGPAQRRSDFEDLWGYGYRVFSNDEVAMPEAARTPERRAPVENPRAGRIGCKDNAAF